MSKGRGYLVLKRKVGQYINIENKISIYVAGLKGNEVSLGIKAPDYTIFRSLEEPEITEVGLLGRGETKALDPKRGKRT